MVSYAIAIGISRFSTLVAYGCASVAPMPRVGCASFVLRLRIGCASDARRMRMVAHWLCIGCASVAHRMRAGCAQAARCAQACNRRLLLLCCGGRPFGGSARARASKRIVPINFASAQRLALWLPLGVSSAEAHAARGESEFYAPVRRARRRSGFSSSCSQRPRRRSKAHRQPLAWHGRARARAQTFS